VTAKTDSTTKRTSGITPEQARDVRARAWRFVFDSYEQKKAADEPGSENDTKGGSKNGS
jgi:hypothetical protein